MRIALLTDGGSKLWCDRLVRGLPQHEFELYTQPAPAPEDRHGLGRRDRRRFAAAFAELAAGTCAADGAAFATGLHGLAELARERPGTERALRSEQALRILEAACRSAPADHHRTLRTATVPDLVHTADGLARALRPLRLDWYADRGRLASADVVHAAAGGTAALPGLLAKRFFGVPLLVTEYGSWLRAHYLDGTVTGTGTEPGRPPAARALLAAFHLRLAAELYARADRLTPGNAHTRRWQEHCGAPRARLRTVYPGMEADRFATVGEAAEAAAVGGSAGHPDEDATLVWVGRVEPAKDLIGLLHAFAEVRRAEPRARLRIFATGAGSPAYLKDCRALAAQLFPDEAADAVSAGENPVAFEEVGGPEAPTPADAYAAGRVVLSSSVVEGFPITLVEAMFCGRATVSTDVGAVFEVIGGTGLVVPPRNPRALAEACTSLLRDPERAARLGSAARARALELFTVEQNTAAFGEIYLDLIATRGPAPAPPGIPFALPAEARVPGNWTAPTRPAEVTA
ncbi:glycosyltransferase [Streptomyces sp. NPDC012888]|uniref:glycosyltransferase n=1 Tax=Streptomyces sp. NPDC012888 TaxID=3364855 RepID=UPI00367C1422